MVVELVEVLTSFSNNNIGRRQTQTNLPKKKTCVLSAAAGNMLWTLGKKCSQFDH